MVNITQLPQGFYYDHNVYIISGRSMQHREKNGGIDCDKSHVHEVRDKSLGLLCPFCFCTCII